MPITICLQRTAIDRAEARMNEQPLATFAPAALRIDQPLRAAQPTLADLVAYGQRLLAALGGAALQAALAPLPRAPELDSLIAIHTAAAELAAIPWEYLHDGADFLIFHYLFVREVPNAPLPAPPDPSLPWRLVVMGSDPLVQEVHDPQTGLFTGYAPLERLNVAQELDLLRDDLLQQNPPAPIRWQRIAPTRQALIDDLATPEPLLFHYTGHGDVENGTPVLCFDDGTGCMDPIQVADLAADLRGSAYFAFLNACRTADSGESGANLALELVKNGVPAVLGTQYKVLDEAAAYFAKTFYRFLAVVQHPTQALYKARLQLKNQYRSDPREWAVPVLYFAQGYTWQVQRPKLTQALPHLEPLVPRTEQLRAPDNIIGRDRELLELARLIIHQQARIVTIRGPGGIGKTALVNVLSNRLRFYFTDGIYALTLALPGSNQGLQAASLRKSLARLLGISHPVFDNPGAVEAQEELIAQVIRSKKRLLLIWDNYETVLWRLGRAAEYNDVPRLVDEEQRSDAEYVQRFVRLLAESGAYMLFTSRQSPVDLPQEVCYPDNLHYGQLQGLDPISSSKLFRQHVGERIPSEEFILSLVDEVGYNPLAIKLAASRWRDTNQTEMEFLKNIYHELVKAEMHGVPHHQRSIFVNVSWSLNNLSQILQERLKSLVLCSSLTVTPLQAAVIWDLKKDGVPDRLQAQQFLQVFHKSSLLEGKGWDEQRGVPVGYRFHPLVYQILLELKKSFAIQEYERRYYHYGGQDMEAFIKELNEKRQDKAIDLLIMDMYNADTGFRGFLFFVKNNYKKDAS